MCDLGCDPIDPASWKPLEVEFIREAGAGVAASDLVMLGTEPAFTARAVEALQDVLFKHGQILPLRSDDGEFYLWHVTTVLDALDEANSELTRFTSGRVFMVRRFAFVPDAVRNAVAFKIPQFCRAFTFVTEAFLRRVREERLVGVAPRVVWAAGSEPPSTR